MIDDEWAAAGAMEKDRAGGDSDMTGDSGYDKASRPQAAKEGRTTQSRTLKDDEANLGTALRAVYQQTIEEEIPQEMLDLLKRLS